MSANALLLDAAVGETNSADGCICVQNPRPDAEARACVKCGRSISRKENHAVCKPCRSSNRRYEHSERRRFRKAIRDHARYMHKVWGHPYAPNFDKFDARLANHIYLRTYRSGLAKILRLIGGFPAQFSPEEIEILRKDGVCGQFFAKARQEK